MTERQSVEREPINDAVRLLSQQMWCCPSRVDFFQEIARRLKPGGWLVSGDFSADTHSSEYQGLLKIWWRTMQTADAPPESLERMQAAYDRDVAVLPPEDVATLIVSGGFKTPVQFLQTGLIHAWFTQRTAQEVTLDPTGCVTFATNRLHTPVPKNSR